MSREISHRVWAGPCADQRMIEFETPRLRLRRITVEDARFILELVNEPSWIQYIGDRKIRTEENARTHIGRTHIAMYEQHGHGLYLVELKSAGIPIGICGLIRRNGYVDVDLGYALMPDFRGQGLAHEAAVASMEHAKEKLGFTRLIAFTALENHRSIRLLEKLGFTFERIERLAGDGPENRRFVRNL